MRVDANDEVARPLDAPAGPTLPAGGERSCYSTGPARRRLPAPGVLVALFAGGQIAAWTLTPVLTHSSPPLARTPPNT
jgi:hypothetical protein